MKTSFFLVHTNLSVGSMNYDYSAYKRRYSHLATLPNQKISYSEVKIKIGPINFKMIRPRENRGLNNISPEGVRTSLGGSLKGSLLQKEHLIAKRDCIAVLQKSSFLKSSNIGGL